MADSILSAKTCTKCKDIKSLAEFCKSKSGKDGFGYWCKTCANATGASWRAANPEKQKAFTAAWVDRNHDRKNASRVAWNKANPERVKAKRLVYREKNAAGIKTTNAAWHAANPGAAKTNNQNRRARQRESGGVLSKGLQVKLFRLQKGKCACCKQPLGDDFHLDHIMPIALGGSNTDGNIQLLRKLCNLQKHAKHPIDFMQSRGFLL